jgi:hypothetical protein
VLAALVAEVEALDLSEGEAPAARVAPRHRIDYRRGQAQWVVSEPQEAVTTLGNPLTHSF